MDEFVGPDVWNSVEQKLHEALATAARAAGLPEEDLVKYEASATHQEILAGLGDSEEGRQHVFGFVRRPTGNSLQYSIAILPRIAVRSPISIVSWPATKAGEFTSWRSKSRDRRQIPAAW